MGDENRNWENIWHDELGVVWTLRLPAAWVGFSWVFGVCRGGFETIVLPRRVSSRFRVSKIFYQVTWKPWAAIGRRLPPSERRGGYLRPPGPLFLLLLLGPWGVLLPPRFPPPPLPPPLPPPPPT